MSQNANFILRLRAIEGEVFETFFISEVGFILYQIL